MIEKFIERSFKARNAAHARHWTTDLNAQHEALGEFYEDLIDMLDKYVEAYQGTFGQMEKAPEEVPNTAKFLREELVWLNENRAKIAKGVPALENILDEVAATYMKVLFKIENLR